MSNKGMITQDELRFGKEAFVHCDSHGRPHRTGWCTVSVEKKTVLNSKTYEEAVDECRQKGLWLFQDLKEQPNE